MKITFDVPETTMCIGAFINYKSEKDLKVGGNFTTTNLLLDAGKYDSVKVNDDGTLTYFDRPLTKKVKQEKTDETN